MDQPIGPRDAFITVGKRSRGSQHDQSKYKRNKSSSAATPQSATAPVPEPPQAEPPQKRKHDDGKVNGSTSTPSASTSAPKEDPDVIMLISDDEEAAASKKIVVESDSVAPVPKENLRTSFSMNHAFGPLMFFGFLGTDEAVAVERPLLSVIEKLPPGYYRKRYGS
ncbi:hypothetical protein HDU76_007964 [Blyttiomyces sp. JEL0837]|nr:hypothetical protein HDU76_007964 [Blyttiomyces sp. JEL0837]